MRRIYIFKNPDRYHTALPWISSCLRCGWRQYWSVWAWAVAAGNAHARKCSATTQGGVE